MNHTGEVRPDRRNSRMIAGAAAFTTLLGAVSIWTAASNPSTLSLTAAGLIWAAVAGEIALVCWTRKNENLAAEHSTALQEYHRQMAQSKEEKNTP